jgi:hypothetical protein
MLPPLPRCSGWGYASLILPSRISLPRKGRRVGLHIVLFEDCSAFTHVAACALALSPNRDTLIEGFSHFVTSMTAPIASGGSEWPGGTCTHLSGALMSSGNFQHRGLHFCGSCDGVWRDKRVIRDCSEQRQVRRAASVLSLRQRPHQLISGSVIGTVTIIPHSAGEEAGRWDQSGKAAMSQVGARSHTDPGRRRSEAPAFGRSFMMRRS